MISCHLEFSVVSTDIIPTIKSDHSLLKLSFCSEKDHARGRGLWKFNASLLQDNDYIMLLKDTINKSVRDSKNLITKELTWDYLKCRICSETISYSIKQKKEKTKHLHTLEKKLSDLEQLLGSRTCSDIQQEYLETQKEIEGIHDEIARGHMIRSRCRLIEEFERPTKYFLNLEKTSQTIRHIRSLKIDDGITFDPDRILNEQKAFYSKLYTEDNGSLDTDDKYCQDIKNAIPKISTEYKELCDQEIDLDEITAVVQSLPNNKSPGPDGFTAEFYKFFWHDIGKIVHQTYKDAYKKGSLIGTQKQGVIHLIPKKDKDLTVLSSWRPLSLLNIDYKILAKVLSKRLQDTLSEIISPDQIGYIKHRFCGENTRLIADVIEYCKIYKYPCIILLIDFEKAFDTVRWSFLHKLLIYYGFGKQFQKWISILYAESESCVTNNGHLSSYFKLSRGIRQGCPISALLFLLVAEVAAVLIRKSKEMHGIHVNEQEIKLCQLADDTTLFLSDSMSVKSALDIFENFYKYSGLRLNKSKTIAFYVQNENIIKKNDWGIKCTCSPFKTLGTWFSNDLTEMGSLNTGDKIKQINSIISSWLPRQLTLKGKITVIKSLILPHILQLASTFSLSNSCIKTLDEIMYNFVWSNKKHLISKASLLLPTEFGGLKMISAKYVCNTTHIMFMKRLFNGVKAKWKALSEVLMGLKVSEILSKKHALTFHRNTKTVYYKNVLSTWFGLITTKSTCQQDLHSEDLFKNPLFMTDGLTFDMEYNIWKDAGILKVRDILDDRQTTFLNKAALENKFNFVIKDMEYNRLINCVAKKRKQLPQMSNICWPSPTLLSRKCIKDITNVNSSEVAKFYTMINYKPPISQDKWIEYYPFLHNFDWSNFIYCGQKLPLILTC